MRALSNPVRLESPEKGVDGRTTIALARAPLVTDGRIGDFAIDTVAKKLYGPKNASGWPDNGLIKGDQGWSPVLGVVTDGARRVYRVTDWQGGAGEKPAVGQYVGATGLVSSLASAVDIRGPQGPAMLIDGIADATADITDATVFATAQPTGDNDKRAAVQVFDLGGTLPRKSIAHAQASTVRKTISTIAIGAQLYDRAASDPGAAGKFRTVDRWTAAGASDSANGGWWALRPGQAVSFRTTAEAQAATIPTGISSVYLAGGASVGDGLDGLFVDQNTGSTDSFLSGDGRTWYRARPLKVGPMDVWPGAFDGVTNDTAKANAFIGKVNAGTVKTVVVPNGTSLVGRLTTITASDVTWLWLGGFKSLANSLSEGQGLITITGSRHRHLGTLEIDGNAASYAGFVACQLLDVSGDGHRFEAVRLHHSAGRGFVSDGMTNFQFGSFCIEDNAGLGFQFARCAYGAIHNSRVRRNGCGYGKTKANPADVSHDFIGFGGAVRYSSHDIDFLGGDYTLNGRDGLNINQGSYNIKHIALRADANDDGGFTMAQDFVGSGIPGDGRPCYNISYIDCDTSNNFSSGIVSYGAVHGLVVRGGAQKNNHRLAGDLLEATSYYNGVFIASGSTGVDIDTMAYDDRQERFVSSITGSGGTRTIGMSAWAALKNTYPKVAIYSAAGTFKGWGKIVSETSDSVTISPTPQNGVSLASIVVGDIITQASQLNGAVLENNVTGHARVKGISPRVGPTPSIQGQVCQLATAGGAGGAQFLDGLPSQNLLVNGSFDAGITGWTFSTPSGGTSSAEAAVARSAGSLKLVGGSGANAEADATLVAGAMKKVSGSKWRVRGWVFSSKPGTALVRMFTNTGPDVVHTFQSRGRGWEPFVLSGGFGGGNALVVRLVATAGETVYFDECSLESIDEAPTRSIVSREY